MAAILNDPIGFFKFSEFKKALSSIEVEKIVDLLEGWGGRYFKGNKKEYLDEVRRFLAKIVFEIGKRIGR